MRKGRLRLPAMMPRVSMLAVIRFAARMIDARADCSSAIVFPGAGRGMAERAFSLFFVRERVSLPLLC